MFFTEQLGIDWRSKPIAVLVIMNLMTAAAVVGSILAGYISDKYFKGHRSPVAMVLYFTEAVVLATAAVVMLAGFIQPGTLGIFLGGLFLVLTSLTVNSTHSIVGAAAPMDIGGKKMAGFAAGVIDSFQYYGSAICLFITSIVLEKYGWAGWYPVMISFALIGGFAMFLLKRKQKRLAAAAQAT
jgi:OPA family glycerol-3-phosphate transporter-like MFS transporter